MYRNILVPIDGSDTATRGLREAIKLAKEQGSRIRIIHVINEVAAISPHLYGLRFQRILEGMRVNGAGLLEEGRALVEAAGVPVESKMVETFGVPAGEYVVDAANEWPADLIICGTHGRRGLRRIVMGSDAEFILRHSPVPVLLVRAQQLGTQPAIIRAPEPAHGIRS